MLEAVRKYVEAGMGALSPKRAQELAKTLVEQGQARREQAGRVARDLLAWSKKNREKLGEVIRREVKKQVGALGIATRGDVEALKKRVRALEGKRPAARATKAKKKT